MAAASAANAAALQGYWKPYKDLLFANQSDWFYSTGNELQQQLETYFEKASDGKGDLTKFREDMKSEKVAKKIAFDRGIGENFRSAVHHGSIWTVSGLATKVMTMMRTISHHETTVKRYEI